MELQQEQVAYDPALDVYEILGLECGAPVDLVEQAYRRTALVWHPDKTDDPEAAERFAEVREAVRILRDPRERAAYDRARAVYQAEAERARVRNRWESAEVGPGQPLGSPPPWLAERVRLHFDSVFLTLFVPQPLTIGKMVATALATVGVVLGFIYEQSVLALLVALIWSAGRATSILPHEGRTAWARLVPGRRVAEFFQVERRLKAHRRMQLPWESLVVTVAAVESAYRVLLFGLPGGHAPVFHSTRDLAEARRFAAQVAAWLQLALRDTTMSKEPAR